MSSQSTDEDLEIDIFLIETIKNYPSQWIKEQNEYTSSDDHEWNKISKQMGINKLWLQRRWQKVRTNFINHKVNEKIHGIRSESYAVGKYEKQLHFLNIDLSDVKPLNGARRVDTSPDTDSDEFCITQEDIDGSYDGCDDREEFEVIETEQNVDTEVSRSSQEEIEIICANDLDIEEIIEKDAQELPHRTERQNKVSGGSKRSFTVASSKADCDRQTKQPDSSIAVKSLPVENGVEASRKDKPIERQGNNYNENEHCEDTIFGQLVAAMLKKMDPPQKKQAKKEIMNILL